MAILSILKLFHFITTKEFMYNHNMNKQTPRKRALSVFLILGLAFLAIGLATDQTVFTWIAIAFLVISLVSGGKWMRPRK
jgi:cell division protein FtsW (lipid II flippase)